MNSPEVENTEAAPHRASAVLLVEDDDMLRTCLAEYLGSRGITATPVDTLESARQLLRCQRFEAVVLDLNLGSDDGLVLVRELADAAGPPVVIATSRVDESDRVLGLELGADDYLVKPYGFRELLARLKNVMRRAGTSSHRTAARRVARFGEWTFDSTSLRLVHESGREASVTGGEMALLRVFIEHPARVLLRNEIIALTHRSDATVFERAIDVLVGRLRRKLEDDPVRPRLIRTIRGEGYRFTAAVIWTTTPDGGIS